MRDRSRQQGQYWYSGLPPPPSPEPSFAGRGGAHPLPKSTSGFFGNARKNPRCATVMRRQGPLHAACVQRVTSRRHTLHLGLECQGVLRVYAEFCLGACRHIVLPRASLSSRFGQCQPEGLHHSRRRTSVVIDKVSFSSYACSVFSTGLHLPCEFVTRELNS